MTAKNTCLWGFAAVCLLFGSNAGGADTLSLKERLKALPFKIAYESYIDGNWDLFVMNADGSNSVNLTKTPNLNEHYPQISPDGSKICYVADEGEGRDAVRSVYVMDIDGKNRKKLADHAREPFWRHDGRVIGFLPQEFPKFNVIDYYTKGMSFYDLTTGKITPHSNSTNIHHLYNPGFSPNGKWIVSTVHAGMGVDHAILLIEADGNRIINLGIPGCRPCLSPDGKFVAWGAGDHELAVAPLDTDAPEPKVGPWSFHIKDSKNKIYHIDWSPDGRFVSFSRGPDGEGDPSKTGTFTAACEIMGVYAPGWNIGTVEVGKNGGVVDLDQGVEGQCVMLTTNGLSNKEPAWFRTQ